MIGLLGPAIVLTAGYACGLKLYTDVSPLQTGMIRVLGGFLVLIFIAVWPTFGE
jgi:hypothetical protein